MRVTTIPVLAGRAVRRPWRGTDGIAINSDRIGGAAATSGQISTVRMANAVPTNTTCDRAKTVNPAGATTGSNKKTSKANDKPAGTTTGSNKDKS